MKLYNFNANSSFSTSQPTPIKFLKSILLMKKLNKETFTGLEVMKFAMENCSWETKNKDNDKRLMETWAFYVKLLKEAGLNECGNIGNSSKKEVSLEDLMNEVDEVIE
jgi:hypothetical protein